VPILHFRQAPAFSQGEPMRLVSLSACVASLACASLTAPTASAQPLVKLNAALGEMVFTVCPTLESARAQAEMSRAWGRSAYDRATAATHLHDKCLRVKATVVPSAIERSIPAFETWTMAYDRNSQNITSVAHGGAVYRFGVTIRKQPAAFYVGQLRLAGGDTFQGWIEIPNEPYLSKYLEEKHRS
jgi:hypothetical protein